MSCDPRPPGSSWLLPDQHVHSTWLLPNQLAGSSYPSDQASLAALAAQGISLLINLHERPHDPDLLARHGLRQLHLPVPDFTPPSPDQVEQGVSAIEQALAGGERVVVHCAAGLGRTGTLLACYLVKRGAAVNEALARVRAARPGSVETDWQELAVMVYARRLRNAAR